MKSMLIRKHKTTGNGDTLREESTMADDDDMKSVRSSATTSSKIGGFLKSKIHVPSFSGHSLKLHKMQQHSTTDIVSEEYHETEESRAVQKQQSATQLRENVNALNQVDIPFGTGKVVVRELQQELDAEKRKTQQLQKDLETEQAVSKKKLADVQSALERERQNYHAIASGDGADATVRRQAETIQELQAMTEALQMRADQLEEDYAESERKCTEAETLQNSLKVENAQLKLQSGGGKDAIKALERERDMLRQRVLALEAESKKKTASNAASSSQMDQIRSLENEKVAHIQEVKSLQGKVAALESRLLQQQSSAMTRKPDPRESEEFKALQALFDEKQNELNSIASAAENELARLDEEVKSQRKQREGAEFQIASLQQELAKVKGEMSKQTAYWKDKLEHDEHYQRATEAARQLLKQKKISKVEFDQVMKAAQEASKVWNE